MNQEMSSEMTASIPLALRLVVASWVMTFVIVIPSNDRGLCRSHAVASPVHILLDRVIGAVFSLDVQQDQYIGAENLPGIAVCSGLAPAPTRFI